MSAEPAQGPDWDDRGRWHGGQLFNPYDDGINWTKFVADAPDHSAREKRLATYRREAGWGRWWAHLRDDCHFRARGRCEILACNRTKGLQVHHTIEGYDHLGEELYDRDVILLCREHHMKQPGHGDDYRWKP